MNMLRIYKHVRAAGLYRVKWHLTSLCNIIFKRPLSAIFFQHCTKLFIMVYNMFVKKFGNKMLKIKYV
jgi:hypothetical protein